MEPFESRIWILLPFKDFIFEWKIRNYWTWNYLGTRIPILLKISSESIISNTWINRSGHLAKVSCESLLMCQKRLYLLKVNYNKLSVKPTKSLIWLNGMPLAIEEALMGKEFEHRRAKVFYSKRRSIIIEPAIALLNS